jgi:ribosomal protein S18 acetylase RimI-like enzyme
MTLKESNLLISKLEPQTSDELESTSDIATRTLRALGLISLVDTELIEEFGVNKTLNFSRVCDRLDEINEWGELLIAQDVDGGRIVGALQAAFYESDSNYNIDYLAVDYAKRGMGIGRELMNVAEQRACERSLEALTLMSLHQSVGFYKQIGFEVDLGRGRGGRTGSYTPMSRAVSAKDDGLPS